MKKKKGQSLVETALVAPILLMLFCGVIDVGRILYAQSRLNLICQESVRLAGLGRGDEEIRAYAKGEVDSETAETLRVDFDPTDSEEARKSGNNVTVIIRCDVKYITPFMNIILPSPFKAETQSTIRVE